RPSSRLAWATHLRIDQIEQPNSFVSSPGSRPARTNSTIWRRKSGAYRLACFDLLDLRMTNSPQVHYEESTKAGQLQAWDRGSAPVHRVRGTSGAFGRSNGFGSGCRRPRGTDRGR